MCAKKQWTGQEKLSRVLQGLKGPCSVSELCNAHGITIGELTIELKKTNGKAPSGEFGRQRSVDFSEIHLFLKQSEC